MPGYLRFPNINSVTISGRLVRDTELRHTPNGVTIGRFCIAVNRFYRDEYGQPQEMTSYIDVVAFGKTAQICAESLKKGSPVLIEGNLRTRTYTDQNNMNKKVTDVIVDRVYPLERDENYVANYTGQTGQPAQPTQQAPKNFQSNENYRGDVEPFPDVNYSDPDLNTEDDVPF